MPPLLVAIQTRGRTSPIVWEEERPHAWGRPRPPSSLFSSPGPRVTSIISGFPSSQADKPAAEQHGVHSSTCGRVPVGGHSSGLSRLMGGTRSSPVSAEHLSFQGHRGLGDHVSRQLCAAPPSLCRAEEGWDRGASYRTPAVYQAPALSFLDVSLHE